jgi:hypothetical protein
LSFVYINNQNNQIKDLENEIIILKSQVNSLETEIELRKAVQARYGINDYYTRKNDDYPYSAYVVCNNKLTTFYTKEDLLTRDERIVFQAMELYRVKDECDVSFVKDEKHPYKSYIEYEGETITVWINFGPPPDRITMSYKPVIYLYGYDEEVNVKIDFNSTSSKFTCIYPEYEDGWTVKANPDGHLEKDGKIYRYLYWEGLVNTNYDFNKGFCIAGKDTASFLEDSLSKLGLNSDEINEFIIYWLPLMQDNNYNIISFQDESYFEAAKLTVNPAPDTMLRVFMAWYPSDTYVEIEEQELVSTERVGKTVIEWGGAKIE